MSRYSVWDHVNPGRMRHDRNMADILLQVPLALGRTSSFLLLHHYASRAPALSPSHLSPLTSQGNLNISSWGFYPYPHRRLTLIRPPPTCQLRSPQLLVLSLHQAPQTSLGIHITWGLVRRQVLVGRSGPSGSLYFSLASGVAADPDQWPCFA